MGDFLSQPITDKNSHIEHDDKLRYCTVDMQGWRKSMEDTHISRIDLGDGNSFFAVFDGHGGKKSAVNFL